MNTTRHNLLVLAGLLACTGSSIAQGKETAPEPAVFVANHGQWPAAHLYRTRSGNMQMALGARGWSCRLPQAGRDVELRFVGDGAAGRVQPEDRAPGVHNYYIGNDPSAWRSGVPLYSSVLYEGLYAGIDLRARHTGGEFEYDLLLEPDADLDVVEVQVVGGGRLSLDPQGCLLIDTGEGALRQSPPVSWEVLADGSRRKVVSAFRILGDDRFGFVARDRTRGHRLVVDPRLTYSSYLGGSNRDFPFAIRAGQGGLVLVGTTWSSDFPVSGGTPRGGPDGFVTVLAPGTSGNQLKFSTFIGGSGSDGFQAVWFGPNGRLHVVGTTQSGDFPVTPGALQSNHAGGDDIVYLQLDLKSPTALVYSTYFGGSGSDNAAVVGSGLVVDSAGAAWICGWSSSTSLPCTSNAIDATYNGGLDCILLGIDAGKTGPQQLVYLSYFGGTRDDLAGTIDLWLDNRSLVISGITNSIDLPTTPGAYQAKYGGGTRDGWVLHVDPMAQAGRQVRFSTLLGGWSDDVPRGVAVDRQGDIHVIGKTDSSNFPTTADAYQRFNNGNLLTFVTQLDITGSRLVSSTMFGSTVSGPQTDGEAIAVDSDDRIVICGSAGGVAPLPTTPDSPRRTNGGIDGYVAVFDPRATRLLHSALIGGSDADGIWDMHMEPGVLHLLGVATGPNFPTTPNAYDRSHNGGMDVMVLQYDIRELAGVRFGHTTPDCTGDRRPTIHAWEVPKAGAPFNIAASQGAPTRPTFLALSLAGYMPNHPTYPNGLPLSGLGIDVFVDPAQMVLVGLFANSAGEVVLNGQIPSGTSGTVYAQFVWADVQSCSRSPFSASDALRITW